jgi:hypothetical protein
MARGWCIRCTFLQYIWHSLCAEEPDGSRYHIPGIVFPSCRRTDQILVRESTTTHYRQILLLEACQTPRNYGLLLKRNRFDQLMVPKEGEIRDDVVQAAGSHWIYVLERTSEELKVRGT